MKHRFVKLTALVTIVALTGLAYAQAGKIVTFTYFSDYTQKKVVGRTTFNQCDTPEGNPIKTLDWGVKTNYVVRSEIRCAIDI